MAVTQNRTEPVSVSVAEAADRVKGAIARAIVVCQYIPPKPINIRFSFTARHPRLEGALDRISVSVDQDEMGIESPQNIVTHLQITGLFQNIRDIRDQFKHDLINRHQGKHRSYLGLMFAFENTTLSYDNLLVRFDPEVCSIDILLEYIRLAVHNLIPTPHSIVTFQEV